MLIPFIDAESGNSIYVNPAQVAVVFEGKNPEGVQLTMINLLNGNVATQEDFLSVVGKIQGELK
jgi:hypothetical protein